MIEAVAGLTLGILTVVIARFSRLEIGFYSLNLIVLPLIYAAFAVYARDGLAVALEMLWGIPFFAGGILLFIYNPRKSTVLIGMFWVGHAAYDLMHASLFSNPGVPGWYPVLCAAFDGVLGLYLLVLSSKVPELKMRRV